MTQIDWMRWGDQLDLLPETVRLNREKMTELDHALEVVWKCAFPDGLNHDMIQQLIYLMYLVDGEEFPMSMRSVASHVGILTGVEYTIVLNEVYGVNEIEPNPAVQLWIRERLQACGYYEWLKG